MRDKVHLLSQHGGLGSHSSKLQNHTVLTAFVHVIMHVFSNFMCAKTLSRVVYLTAFFIRDVFVVNAHKKGWVGDHFEIICDSRLRGLFNLQSMQKKSLDVLTKTKAKLLMREWFNFSSSFHPNKPSGKSFRRYQF